MTALENNTPYDFSGMHADDARARGMNLLEKVGLPNAGVIDLRQCLAAAATGSDCQTLANNPKLLLCDEPTETWIQNRT